jgi:hypothetical protein
MISLDASGLISSGTVRDCYRHPTDPGRVIKVAATKKKADLQANIRELRGYQILMREHVDLFCISHCYGFVTTDRGTGLVCDSVRDDSGEISKTIREIVVYGDGYDIDSILQAVEKFCDFFILKDVFLFDLNPRNIVLQKTLNGSYQPVVIDLKGRYENHEFIPLSSYIAYFARRKLKRRCDELIGRILRYHSKRTKMESAG